MTIIGTVEGSPDKREQVWGDGLYIGLCPRCHKLVTYMEKHEFVAVEGFLRVRHKECSDAI